VPRYIKHLSRNELFEKISHLGLKSHRARAFVNDAGEIVVVDTSPLIDAEKTLVPLLLKEKVTFLLENGKIIISFNAEEEIEYLTEKLETGPLAQYLERIRRSVNHIHKRHTHFLAKGKRVELGTKPPLLMGIVNVTPDSFSDGGKYFQREKAISQAREMVLDGADIIDIGGESTRPGAAPVEEEEEMERVLPVIEKLAATTEVLISVDTYKSTVAREALKAGAHIVNDVSGLRFSKDMAEVASHFGAAVIIMHMKGTPREMQKNPQYYSLPDEILDQLSGGVNRGKRGGIRKESILVDPGIGFGKRYEDNIYILKNLEEFRSAGYPVVVGVSRKAFIGQATGKNVHDRISGTAAAVSVSIYNGADVVRVHDVKEIRDTVLVAWEIRRGMVC
jgi:dihydropteroate synthase